MTDTNDNTNPQNNQTSGGVFGGGDTNFSTESLQPVDNQEWKFDMPTFEKKTEENNEGGPYAYPSFPTKEKEDKNEFEYPSFEEKTWVETTPEVKTEEKEPTIQETQQTPEAFDVASENNDNKVEEIEDPFDMPDFESFTENNEETTEENTVTEIKVEENKIPDPIEDKKEEITLTKPVEKEEPKTVDIQPIKEEEKTTETPKTEEPKKETFSTPIKTEEKKVENKPVVEKKEINTTPKEKVEKPTFNKPTEEKKPFIKKEQPKPIEKENIDKEPENKEISDLTKKFNEFFANVKKVYELKRLKEDETFEIVGSDNAKLYILYLLGMEQKDNEAILITKTQTNRESDETESNVLKFVFNKESNSLNILINDELILDEKQDLSDDASKKMQVMDKINKFNFLVEEHYKKLEKEIQEKQEAKEKRKKLMNIFRNF